MRFLAAIVLLALAIAEAHHAPEHTLRGPRFVVRKTHIYDVEFNVTSGVPGLSTQVSKAVIKARAHIYAKDNENYILKLDQVYTSGSQKAVESNDATMELQKNEELERKLSMPIRFKVQEGNITEYTLSKSESLESMKIKRSILRSLEMYIPEEVLEKMESKTQMRIPVTYNVSENTETGSYVSKYLITVSPDSDYPDDTKVYNITRSDDFEGNTYPSYHLHHNFRRQGCPEVCRNDWTNNKFGAGCPVGHEPHNVPIKTSFTHSHHLSLVDKAVMVPEIIQTSEIHVANMYDQDLEVLVLFRMVRVNVLRHSIEEPKNQDTYNDLKNMKKEIQEEDIKEHCYKSPENAVSTSKELLRDLARIIVEGNLGENDSNFVGEKLILLQKALRRLNFEGFRTLQRDIRRLGDIRSANEEDRVKRQIWMDILPLVGTEESVKYIVSHTKSGLTGRHKEVSVWEAKEMLEALPYNVMTPNENIISALKELLGLPKLEKTHLLHSAVHLSIARVVGRVCGQVELIRSPSRRTSWFSNYQQAYSNFEQNSLGQYAPVPCPESIVKELVEDISRNLTETESEREIAIYIEALAHIGIPEVLPVLSKYVYGTADNLKHFNPEYIDFAKTVALYALHNVVGRYPDQILETVIPVFFNKTEAPKVRNAAFGVLIRSQPSMQILQHVVTESWAEQSKEVGSFVTSTFDHFGNSSLPCMALTAHRIKKVQAQMKRFDIGIHHAKNFMWTYFDDLRDTGLESRFEYTPSTESYIPSAIYNSLSYSTDSLRETLYQLALNVQGVTSKEILDFIYNNIIVDNPPKSIELTEEIFGQAKVSNRNPGDFRMTFFKKLFYYSSYYYLKTGEIKSDFAPLVKHFNNYVQSTDKWDGHLIKIFIPSSLHSVAIARTLPYPVEFEMKQPLVFALKIKSLGGRPYKFSEWNLHVKPSVYMTKVYSHQMKNLGDCKEVGVSREMKYIFAYPVDAKFKIEKYNITASYKIPASSNRVFTYISEASTYAATKKLSILPYTEGKAPIRTLPSPFKYEKKLRTVGFPALNVEYHTEDIGIFTEKMPRNLNEIFDVVIRKALNAGWRYKSVNVTTQTDRTFWPSGTEVTFTTRYNKEHVARKIPHQPNPWESQWSSESENTESNWHNQSDSDGDDDDDEDYDWEKVFKRDDIEETRDPDVFIKQGVKALEKINRDPHIEHSLKIRLDMEPHPNNAFIDLTYKHTYTGSVHIAYGDVGTTNFQGKAYKMGFEHVMAFLHRPNQFKYPTHNGKHFGLFLTAFDTYCNEDKKVWDNVDVISKGLFLYDPLKNTLSDELLYDVEDKYYEPETDAQCKKDVEEGNALSDECIKAIREKSIYNHIYMKTLWVKNLPAEINNTANVLDILLKHMLFRHMHLKHTYNEANEISVVLNYINKFTDKPVFDLLITKPNEMVNFTRVPASRFLPLSSIYSIPEMTAMEYTNNTYPPYCALTEKYVKTFDHKTYEMPSKTCSYVLSAHCSEYKKYAVIAEASGALSGSKTIYFYVANHTIKLTPREASLYTVEVDKEKHVLKEFGTSLFDKKEDIYAYTYKTQDKDIILEVHAKKAGVTLTYNGLNVIVEVSPIYKGELCGLCSEFDGEILRENRGVDECLYRTNDGFISSSITDRDQCPVPEPDTENRICDESTPRFAWERPNHEDDHQTPSTRRNVVLQKGNEICFSNLPVPVCSDNAVPFETESQTLAFHCLPKRDQTARWLLVESKRRVLGELAGKSVDFEEVVDVATSC